MMASSRGMSQMLAGPGGLHVRGTHAAMRTQCNPRETLFASGTKLSAANDRHEVAAYRGRSLLL